VCTVCYANYRFLSFYSHLVEFQVHVYLSLDNIETLSDSAMSSDYGKCELLIEY